MYLEKKGHVCNSAKNVGLMPFSIQFFSSPSTTFLLFKTHIKKCKKPIRIRMCRFLLTAKNDCRYTVFNIDLKKVYCTGPEEGLKIRGGASCNLNGIICSPLFKQGYCSAKIQGGHGGTPGSCCILPCLVNFN